MSARIGSSIKKIFFCCWNEGKDPTLDPTLIRVVKSAVKSDNWKEARELILAANKQDLEAKNKKGETVLHHLAAFGRGQEIEYARGRGVSLDCKDSEGKTPFMWAISKKDPQVASLLLSRKMVITNDVTKKGETALHLAAAHGDKSTLNYLLLNSGVKSQEIFDKMRYTPFMRAVANGHFEAAQKILNCRTLKVNVNAKTKKGETPLYFAVKQGHFDMVKFLIEEGAPDVALSAKDGRTLLALAERNGHPEILKLLKDALLAKSAADSTSQEASEKMGIFKKVIRWFTKGFS